jgi:hypothetical protein
MAPLSAAALPPPGAGALLARESRNAVTLASKACSAIMIDPYSWPAL